MQIYSVTYLVSSISDTGCAQNPASGDALTKLQDDVGETKIVLVKILPRYVLFSTIGHCGFCSSYGSHFNTVCLCMCVY